jgi:predicted transcriptional regulator of viral defense system
MQFNEMLAIVGDEPVFETGLLLAGDVDPNDVRRQLSRWTKAGRLFQLRRGLYALAPPYQRVPPHPFLVANRLAAASYVSLQSALAFHGIIPEFVARTTSVTTVRPDVWQTPLGDYVFRHIKQPLFFGYALTNLGNHQQALVATPEKALLDLIYLQPGGDAPAYLMELRLQNLEQLDLALLLRFVERADKPKLRRAAAYVSELAEAEGRAYESL